MSMERPRGSDGLTESSFRSILDAEGVQVVESGVMVPEALDDAAIAALPAPAAQWLTGTLLPAVRTYLAMPALLDRHAAHPERRTWRDELDRKHPGFKLAYERNKLKRNNIGAVRTYFEYLASLVEGAQGRVPDAIRAAYAALPDVFPAESENPEDDFARYEQMSTEEKLGIIRRTEQAIAILFEAITPR